MRALWDGLLELLHMVAEMFVLVAFLGLVIGAVVFADAMIGAAP